MDRSVKAQILLNIAFAVMLILLLSIYCISSAHLLNNENNEKSVSVTKNMIPQKTVLIDPGHGGEDGGAVGINGTLEKDLNLALSKNLREILTFSGYQTIMTRYEDKMLYDRGDNYQGRKKILDLKGRLDIANSLSPDLFVGIHMNSFPESQYSGLSIYYSRNNQASEKAAYIIDRQVKALLQPNNNREPKAASSNIYILDRIKCPAILIECGFLSNPEECQKLSTLEYRNKLTFIFYNSLVSFLEE